MLFVTGSLSQKCRAKSGSIGPAPFGSPDNDFRLIGVTVGVEWTTMINKRILCSTLFAAYAIPAFAADLPAPLASPIFAPPEPVGAWSGFYVGGNAGYGFGNGGTSFTPLPNATSFIALRPTRLDPHPDGFLGGGQVGYLFQSGRLVFGGEADFQGSDVRGSTSLSPFLNNLGASTLPGTAITAGQRLDWYGTVRARVGTTVLDPRVLVYATGGFAYGRERFFSLTDYSPAGGTSYLARYGGTRTGWTAGAGAEYALFRNVSLKIEYLHIDLGESGAVAAPSTPIPFQVGYRSRIDIDTIRAGVNFRFGMPAPAVVARY